MTGRSASLLEFGSKLLFDRLDDVTEAWIEARQHQGKYGQASRLTKACSNNVESCHLADHTERC